MNNKIRNRHRLKNKRIREIQDLVEKNFSDIIFDENSVFEIGDVNDSMIIFIDELPCFKLEDNEYIITLAAVNKYKPKGKYVIVDMGAVKFVTNGADVMAPGIVNADSNISVDDQVWICDEKHHKPLAVGIALKDGPEMIESDKGKAVRIINYVGDWLWNFSAKSL